LLRCLVRQENFSIRVNSHDCRGTAFHQDLQLIFGVAPQFDFTFELFHVLKNNAAIFQEL